MIGFYIDGNEAKMTRVGETTVKLEMADGRTFDSLEVLRLFPVSGMMKYISLTNGEGKEVAIIRDVEKLSPDSAKAIYDCLDSYYIVPNIVRLVERVEKHYNITWTVETDRGIHTFEIRNTSTDIKILPDGRVFIRDSNDNRYLIPDLDKLDKKSKAFLRFDM